MTRLTGVDLDEVAKRFC